MITYDILLDPRGSGFQQTVRGFYRGEAGEKRLRITLMQPSEIYVFDPQTHVVVFGQKPDGTCIVHACTIEDGKAIYIPTTQTVAAAGSVHCQLVVYDSAGKILFTPEFCLEVEEPARNETQIESTNDFQYLDSLILKVTENIRFLQDIPPLTSGTNGTLLCDDTLVGAVIYAEDFNALPVTPNGQLAYVQSDLAAHRSGFYLRIFDAWMRLPDPDTHAHENIQTLDRLSVSGNTLLFDGNPIEANGVQILRICSTGEGWFVPTAPEGTLLYVVTGDEPDLLCWPPVTREHPSGTTFDYQPPWQAGQLWVSSGGKWNLLYQHPWSENDVGGEDNIGCSTENGAIVRSLQALAHSHDNSADLDRLSIADGALCIDGQAIHTGENTQSDDVVLLPFGVPMDLVIRPNFFQVPLYLDVMQALSGMFMYALSIRSEDSREISLSAQFGNCCLKYKDTHTNGYIQTTTGNDWYDRNGHSVPAPDLRGFSLRSVIPDPDNGVTAYTVNRPMPQRHRNMFRTFCQVINTSQENMGAIVLQDRTEVFKTTDGVRAGRKYALTLDAENNSFIGWENEDLDEDEYLETITQDARAEVLVYIMSDCTPSIGYDCLVNGVEPSFEVGFYKWIFNRLPTGQISLQTDSLVGI